MIIGMFKLFYIVPFNSPSYYGKMWLWFQLALFTIYLVLAYFFFNEFDVTYKKVLVIIGAMIAFIFSSMILSAKFLEFFRKEYPEAYSKTIDNLRKEIHGSRS